MMGETNTVTRTEYLYDGQMPVMERDYNGSGNLSQTRVNVLGARGIEGIITVPASGSASLKWLMYDGHGNMVRTMSTSFGLSAYQWRGVWGERQTGTLQVGKGYCANLGHQEDETGLVYMRARYYEPTTGRFISEDPARDGVNWYLYADGNPVNRVDASGRNSNAEQFLRNLAALLLSPFFPLRLMVALGTACAGMSAIFALSARLNSGGKGMPKDDVDALVISVAYAGIATICFGFASLGLEGSREALAAMINAVISSINTLAQIVSICGGSVRAGGGWGFVCGTAMFMYGLYLFGALVSVEAEQNMGS